MCKLLHVLSAALTQGILVMAAKIGGKIFVQALARAVVPTFVEHTLPARLVMKELGRTTIAQVAVAKLVLSALKHLDKRFTNGTVTFFTLLTLATNRLVDKVLKGVLAFLKSLKGLV